MIGDILQPTHLLFVLVVALLVLGPKRLPEVGRSLGRGMRDFRQALSGDDLRDALTGTHETPRETGHSEEEADAEEADTEPSKALEPVSRTPTQASATAATPAPGEPEHKPTEPVKQNVA